MYPLLEQIGIPWPTDVFRITGDSCDASDLDLAELASES